MTVSRRTRAARWGGVLLLTMSGNEGKLAYFGGMDHVRFRRAVVPGDTVITEAELLKNRGNVGKIRCTASVGDQTVAEGEFMFALVERDRKKDAADDVVDSLAK